MSVRAKVNCTSLEKNEIKFTTVFESTYKDTENARFTTATPSGEIRLVIDNPEALSQFTVGKSYYVDFNPAE